MESEMDSPVTKMSSLKDSVSCCNGESNSSLLQSNYFEAGMDLSNQDIIGNFDPNRRSSLGAESLMEHDFNEEIGSFYDSESAGSEAYLGIEYVDDIFWLNKYNEQSHHPRLYIEKQPQITEYMRCTLVNWLIKVNHELKFGPDTIFIAVSLTDKFLASMPIAQDCLQLLAVCALFVAAKLEESIIPGISALVTLCGSAYKHYHFRRMESLLLSTLRFQIHTPTSWFFVTYISLKSSTTISIDRRAVTLARYTVETCLSDYKIVQYFPSEQAASAMILSCLVLYSPNSVYKEKEDEAVNNENIFENLSSLNSFCASLYGTLGEIFSCEELENVVQCFDIMKDYMKPFLQYSDTSIGILNINLPPCQNNDSEIVKEKGMRPKHNVCCETCSRSIYNEEKESFERISVIETHRVRPKFSPYSLTYEMKQKFSPNGFPSVATEKHKSKIDLYCSKNALGMKDSLYMASRKHKNCIGSICDKDERFARNSSVSLPSDLNIT